MNKSDKVFDSTIKRVKQLMRSTGLDTKDDMLVLNISIIYLEAQKDQLEKRNAN